MLLARGPLRGTRLAMLPAPRIGADAEGEGEGATATAGAAATIGERAIRLQARDCQGDFLSARRVLLTFRQNKLDKHGV